MKTILSVIWLLFCCFNCQKSKSTKYLQEMEVTKIQVLNRTQNNRLKQDSTIQRKEDIKTIDDQLKSLKNAPDVNIKNNFGYYGLKIFFKNGTQADFDIVQTVFDGIVIVNDDTNETFHNNELYTLTLHYLSKNQLSE